MPAGRRRPARTSPLEEDTMTKTLSVGWIGLGAMGAPMALVTARAGHRVTAFDMSREALEAVAPEVGSAGSARAAAEGADVVVIMVATGPQLDAVLFGEAGIAEVLSPQSTVLVMSTVGPRAMDEASARLLPVTSHVVDAPVSGGVARAGTGDLLVMVSGAQDDIAAARPLLDAMASNAPVVGLRPGDGQRFKVVNQLLCGVHIAAAGEALALAESMGLDVAQCHEVLNTGAAASFMFGDRGQRMVDEQFDEARSALNIFVKDMGLVTDAARLAEQPVPLAASAEQLYLRGRREGLGRKDDSVVFDLLRRR
jgi:3-hydroxyisobutyrate dehydrogenase